MKMIRVILSSRLQDLRRDVSEEEVRIYVPRQLAWADCVMGFLNYAVCSPYLVAGEPREESLVLASSRRLLLDLSREARIFSEIWDLVSFSPKYPLYRKLYELGESEASIYRILAAEYLERGAEDLEVGILVNAPRAGFSIRGGRLAAERRGGAWIASADIARVSRILGGLRRSLGEYVSPVKRLFSEFPVSGGPDPPPPESMIEIPEGAVLPYKKIRGRLEILPREPVEGRRVVKILKRASSSRIAVDRGSGVRLVVKRFSDPSAAKWVLVSPAVDIMTLVGVKPKMLPSTRFWNEYRSSLLFRERGMMVPRILYIDPWDLVMVKEYVEGQPLSSFLEEGEDLERAVEAFMRTIALAHSSGLCLVDTKPDNFVAGGRGGIYYVDLEQAGPCLKPYHMAWDIAIFSYFAAIMVPEKALAALTASLKMGVQIYMGALSPSVRERERNKILRSLSDPRLASALLLSLSIIDPLRLRPVVRIFKELSPAGDR